MDSIVNRLTEIEDAASAIVRHAEEEKEILDQEYDKKRKAFDDELEKKDKRTSGCDPCRTRKEDCQHP